MKKTLLIVFCLLSIGANAQIETDRPDFTESPNVVPKGALQVETGFILENDYSAEEQRASKVGLSERNFTMNTTLLRYGLTENIELRLNTSFDVSKVNMMEDMAYLGDSTYNPILGDIKGFSTSFIGFKTNLLKTDKVSLGFLGHLYIPQLASGDYQKVSGQHLAPEFLIPCSIDLTDKWGIAFQYGLTWDGFTPNPTTSYTLALGYGITDELSFYVEPYGFLTTNGDELHLLNGGFTYLVNDNFQLDLTGGVGLNEAAPDNFLNFGASFLLFNKDE
ncbi:MAG: transporter [Bacteroidia bacterium]